MSSFLRVANGERENSSSDDGRASKLSGAAAGFARRGSLRPAASAK